MSSVFYDKPVFNAGFVIAQDTLSTGAQVNSAIGLGIETHPGWSITNLTIADRTISATEATAANIAASLATLIYELGDKGIIKRA